MPNLIETKNKTNEELMVEVGRLYRRVMQSSPSFLFRENYKGTPESPKAIKRHDYTVEVGYFNPTEKGLIFVSLKSATAEGYDKAFLKLIEQLNAEW
jgi:hypothetical protein